MKFVLPDFRWVTHGQDSVKFRPAKELKIYLWKTNKYNFLIPNILKSAFNLVFSSQQYLLDHNSRRCYYNFSQFFKISSIYFLNNSARKYSFLASRQGLFSKYDVLTKKMFTINLKGLLVLKQLNFLTELFTEYKRLSNSLLITTLFWA